uniref:Uncharacterized protein n=1 Tax=Opuntia streptacantha TaxID=393608 RepID=A0A7C8YZL3_OPUST
MTRQGTGHTVILICLIMMLVALLPSSAAAPGGVLSHAAMYGTNSRGVNDTARTHSLQSQRLRMTRGIGRRPRMTPTYGGRNTSRRTSNAVKSHISWLYAFFLLLIPIFFL